MCGRFGVEFSYVEAARHYQAALEIIDPPDPLYNIAPRTQIPMLRIRDSARILTTARWGLIPYWAKDPKIGDKLINARGETLATNNSFREPFEKRRVVIPASFFYEWQKVGGAKIPHVIRRVDGQPISFAGLASVWKDRGTD